MSVLYSIHLLSGFKESLIVIGQFSLFSFFFAFHWSPSTGKPCITLLYPSSRLRNHTMLHWLPSFGIPHITSCLRQDYGTIQCLQMNHSRFADWVTIWVVHLPKRVCLVAALDQTVRATHSCNWWLLRGGTRRRHGSTGFNILSSQLNLNGHPFKKSNSLLA